MLAGVSEGDSLGSDALGEAGHRHDVNIPTLAVQGHTVGIELRGPDWPSKNNVYSVTQGDGEHTDGADHIETDEEGTGEGQHRHRIDSGLAHTVKKDGVQAEQATWMPPHAGVRFIIRMR
ncbi:hypothetical protein [Pseudobythopirellula maris]|uniref:hypothetical protein n=1 Tax=Pseudobythopirellula maris TaxID=2527991 RepID=UPI0011B485BB|nr:hypothetical protein [Pseudobythopirellula maris]